MEDYIIAEEYELPSKGKVYSREIDPNVKIRSMTTQEEMKRLNRQESPYKMLSEIIDDCLVTKPGISVYDMHLGDYQFLLHKLRIVTYGADYDIITHCPYCGNTNESTIDLESLEVSEYSEDYLDHLVITLPQTKKIIKLRMQSPRMFDDINSRAREALKKSSDIKGDPAFLFTIENLIELIDNVPPTPGTLETFVRQLPMKDANYILKSAEKLNQIGINTVIECECMHCKKTFKQNLPITGEFFGPSID